jgi:5'-3' exonuclease
MTHLLLLDTSSLLYRAFFGLPTSIKDPSGRAVNAVHGYLDMTARLYGSRQPDRLIHVYDDVFVPSARAQAYPAYKTHRPPDPPELPPQFELLEQALDALGLERASAAD